MSETLDKKSITQLIGGAIEERVDYEVNKVIDNILDPNTKATAKRKITLTLVLTPDEDRRIISLQAVAKATLIPTNPVSSALCVTADKNGQMTIVEMTPQIPGQRDIYGGEQSSPPILKLVGQA